MKALPRFFTPPLSAEDRAIFFQCLGFGDLTFHLLETCGPLVVRAKRYQGMDGRALLCPVTALQESPEPLLFRRHGPQALCEEPLSAQPSLWEELFPYPFSLIGRLYGPDADSRLQLTPPSLKSQLKLLWEALQRLEDRMSSTEVSCLWLKGGLSWQPLELPMLFHYVRRKRIRVGTAPSLREMGDKYRRGLLSPESLREQFGTQSAFYYLGLEGLGTGADLVPSLVDRILRTLEAADKPAENSPSPVVATAPHGTSPSGPSQFEL